MVMKTKTKAKEEEKVTETIPCCKICGKPKKKQEIMTDFAKKMQEADPNGFYRKPLRPLTIWVSQCDCEQKEAERKERRKANIERIKELRKLYKQAGFTRRQLGMRLRHISNEHKEKFAMWLKDFKPRRSKGMYFYGGVGNGKTTSASCIAKELVNAGYKKVYFYTMAQYLNFMQATYKEDSKITFEQLLEKWFNADAIFIDDFGREKYTEKRLENVFQFFDGLYANCTTFFVISNPENMLRVKEITEFEAIFDRFSETLEKVVFTGKSLRKQEK